MSTPQGLTPAGDLAASDYLPYDIAVYRSAARTATPATGGFGIPKEANAVMVIIKTTAAGSSPSTVPTIEFYNPVSDSYEVALTGAAITGTGTIILRIHPGATAATNLTLDSFVPRVIQVTMTHGNATSHTYSVSAHFSHV